MRTRAAVARAAAPVEPRVLRWASAGAGLSAVGVGLGVLETSQRQLLELAPDGIFIADSGGCSTAVNEGGAQLLGYGRDALVGSTFCFTLPLAGLHAAEPAAHPA